MPEEIFSTAVDAVSSSQITIINAVLTTFIAFALGMLISFTYIKTHTRGVYSQNFTLTLIMIPAIIAIIILLVGSNIARAFSLAGAFSIIRFRSTPGDPKDIAYVFFTMAAGLACGVGLHIYAVILTGILCLFMFILCKVNYGDKKSSNRILKIVIPEDLNYHGAFDDILDNYTTSYELKKVKTTDLGTLFELVFVVNIKSANKEKEFLDAIRSRNGNLNIVLALNADATNF